MRYIGSPDKNIKHNNPKDYDLSEDEVSFIKRRAERQRKEVLEDELSSLRKIRLNAQVSQRWFAEMQIEQKEKKLALLEKRLIYTKNKMSAIDINELKVRVKIKDVLEMFNVSILGKNFFKIRNENTPSAQFNEDKNVWCDYGNGNKGGSVIDLYMILSGCNIATAIKELNKII